jgi:hypothetical protein
MSMQTVLIEKIKRLPEDQQMLVKSLVDELARGRGRRPPSSSGHWFGALEHLGVEITEDEIAEARQEMWRCPSSVVSCPLQPTTDHGPLTTDQERMTSDK